VFGQKQFVTRGLVLILVLLAYGTVFAEEHVAPTNTLESLYVQPQSTINLSLNALNAKNMETSSKAMEEIVVNYFEQTISIDETAAVADYRFFRQQIEFLPRNKLTSTIDHADVIDLKANTGKLGFVQLLGISFGGAT